MEQDEKKQKKDDDNGHGHSHEHAHGEESAKIVALGSVKLGGATFSIDRDGQVEAGATTEFGVELVGGKGVPTGAWIANPDGKKLCDVVVAEDHLEHWHFNVEPLYPVKKAKFVLQLGAEEVAVDFARGAAPVNEGILSVFGEGGERKGFLELKLHGDAGDLEMWLYSGFAVSDWKTKSKPAPFDIPPETVMCLTFQSGTGLTASKSLEMRVRNMGKNEGEDGEPNMRGGGTNYFIFPGESGADPEWLVGEKNRYLVSVAFEANGKKYSADPFVLVPHEAL